MTAISATGMVTRGHEATFTASGNDPDQDHIDWTWAAVTGDCPDPQDVSRWPPADPPTDASMPTTFTVSDVNLTSARFCVWAFATDRYGAVGSNNHRFDPGNTPPVANIRVLDPGLMNSYPLYTKFQLSGEQSSDPDNDEIVSYSWNIDQMPIGSSLAFLPSCDETGNTPDQDSIRCLRTDLPDQYVVSLVVNDSLAPSSPAKVTLNVLPDAPPCIDITEPDYSTTPTTSKSPNEDTVFRVDKVRDDGDPYPAQPLFPLDTVHFTWSYAKEGAPLAFVDNNDFFQLTIPAAEFAEGDTVVVRVEVHDRNWAAIDNTLLSCGDAAALCPNTAGAGTQCHQRVSWKIVYR